MDYWLSRALKPFVVHDRSIDLKHFELSSRLPATAIKVAESGIRPSLAPMLRDKFGFHSLLVGTSLLMAEDVAAALAQFEVEIHGARQGAPNAGLPLPVSGTHTAPV